VLIASMDTDMILLTVVQTVMTTYLAVVVMIPLSAALAMTFWTVDLALTY